MRMNGILDGQNDLIAVVTQTEFSGPEDRSTMRIQTFDNRLTQFSI